MRLLCSSEGLNCLPPHSLLSEARPRFVYYWTKNTSCARNNATQYIDTTILCLDIDLRSTSPSQVWCVLPSRSNPMLGCYTMCWKWRVSSDPAANTGALRRCNPAQLYILRSGMNTGEKRTDAKGRGRRNSQKKHRNYHFQRRGLRTP